MHGSPHGKEEDNGDLVWDWVSSRSREGELAGEEATDDRGDGPEGGGDGD